MVVEENGGHFLDTALHKQFAALLEWLKKRPVVERYGVTRKKQFHRAFLVHDNRERVGMESGMSDDTPAGFCAMILFHLSGNSHRGITLEDLIVEDDNERILDSRYISGVTEDTYLVAINALLMGDYLGEVNAHLRFHTGNVFAGTIA